MRGYFEQLLVKHGEFWVIALLAVMVSKMYGTERNTLVSVIKSIIAALVVTYLVVEKYAGTEDHSTVMLYVFIISFLVDAIVDAGVKLKKVIRDDPSILLRYLPWRSK